MTKFPFCSNGATECDDGQGGGIAQACNSEDIEFCELDDCCLNINIRREQNHVLKNQSEATFLENEKLNTGN